MADGDNEAGGLGIGMILGLLIVILVVVGGGLYFFTGRSAPNPVPAVASAGSHTISGSATVQ
jgi:hypothetical protein